MSMLAKVEKIEREIFKQGNNFTVKNTILTGRKGKDNVKLDSVYNKAYQSNKYSNVSELHSITISTSEYLVFAYNNFEAKTNEEIFISYPHMADIKSFTQNMLNMVMSNKVFDKHNQVTMEYKDYQLNSNALGGNKVLVAIPTTIQRDQNLLRGVYLFFNGEDKYVEMDLKAVFTLNEVIKSFDLLTTSNATLMLGMISNISSVSDDEETFTPAPKSPLGNRSLFGNRNANNFQRRNEAGVTNHVADNTPKAPVESSDDPFNEPPVNSTPVGGKFNKPANTGIKPRTNTNVTAPEPTSPAPTGENVLSMSNIMSEAENINFDSSEEELIEF